MLARLTFLIAFPPIGIPFYKILDNSTSALGVLRRNAVLHLISVTGREWVGLLSVILQEIL